MDKFCSFNGKSIHYSVQGSGPAIVFLHGFLEDFSFWEFIIPYFEKEYCLICIDLPGHGKTSVFGELHSMQLMSDVVSAVLKNENKSHAIITGHSMGGYVALNFAKRYSEKCKGIALINSTAGADSEEKKNDRLRGIKVIRRSQQAYVNEAIPRLFADKNREKFQNEIKHALEIAMQTPVEGVVACINGMMEREDNMAFLKATSLPVLFIAGKYDNIVPEEKSIEQIHLNENINGMIMENSGHLSIIEEKEATVFLLKSFFHSVYKKAE